MRQHITIKDIARIAGVSTSTVSRALSNSPELSEQTRQRILEICQREGYRVNALARSLICNKTNVIGLIVPEVTNPFYAELSLGIETHARSLGYNVILCNGQNDTKVTEELFGFLISHQVDGIILIATTSTFEELAVNSAAVFCITKAADRACLTCKIWWYFYIVISIPVEFRYEFLLQSAAGKC